MKSFLKFLGHVAIFVISGGLALFAGISLSAAISIIDKIEVEDTTTYFPKDRDPVDLNAGKALNYLLIGSDDRSGDNAAIGGFEEGMRADTSILLHISANRDRVELISIPRDSIVDIPTCITSQGDETPPLYSTQFNASYAQGDTPGSSAICTLRTLEENTGLHIDGYIVVDFQGFQGVVDAIGGVKMNIPHDMVAEKADLYLSAGEQTLNGKDALAYARARTFEVGESDGSDLGRIERQQELLSALSNQIISAEVLTNPAKIIGIISSSLDHTTVSSELSNIKDVAGFAFSLRNLKPENVLFYTIPNEPWIQDPNRVIWSTESSTWWNNLINDIPIIEYQE